VYLWEITGGAGNGTITAGANTNQATVRKTGKTGDFTVKLTVTTTDPVTGEATTKTAERQVGAAPFKAVESASISGDASVKNGSAITLSGAYLPADASYPEFKWAVIGSGAAIEGSDTGTTVSVKGASDTGSVTVRLTVKTEGYGGGVTTEKTADKTITLEPAGGISAAYYEWDAATATTVTVPNSDGGTQVNGKTWLRTGGTIAFTAGSEGLPLGNGRFLIGSGSTAATSNTVYDTAGELNFSTKKKISITYTAAAAAGNFIVYINNNTTSQASSVLGNSNRLVNAPPVTPATTWEYTVDPAAFSNHASLATAFLQIRADSNASIVITKILIEAVD
jgi:hypothetical protein